MSYVVLLTNYCQFLKSTLLTLATFCSILILSSCGSESTSVDIPNYDVSSAKDGTIYDVFANVEITPLQFGENYPSVTQSLLVTDGKIFILDNKAILHVFSSDGNYMACSKAKFGNGPDEYSILMGFNWNPYIKAIEILTPDKLIIFDESFNLLRYSNLPTKVGKDNILYDEIYDLSSTKHILHTTNYGGAPYRIDFFDSESGKVIASKSYANDVSVRTTMQSRSFYPMPDGSIFFTSQAITDALYTFPGDIKDANFSNSLIKSMSITTDNEVTKGDVSPYDSDPAKYAKFLFDTSKRVRLRVLPNSTKIFAIYKAGDSTKSMFTAVIDRNSGESIKIKTFCDGEYKFPLIEYVDETYAYAVLEKETLETRHELLMNNSRETDSILNTIEDESLVLLKYEIK